MTSTPTVSPLNFEALSTPVVNLPRRWIDSVLPAELPTMAREIIRRIRRIFVKGSPQRESVDVNLLLRETTDLLRSKVTRYDCG